MRKYVSISLKAALAFALIAAIFFCGSCSIREKFEKKTKESQSVLNKAKKAQEDSRKYSDIIKGPHKGMKCGYKYFALAENEKEFSEYEFSQGNYSAANKHADLAEEYSKEAYAKANAWEDPYLYCNPPDRDHDGILDMEDICPDDPGYGSPDGCPNPDKDKDAVCDPWVAENNQSEKYKSLCKGSDKCPKDPGFGSPDGCPNPDKDKDQICDPWVKENKQDEKYKAICRGFDKCPDDPGYGSEDGCPIPDQDGDGVCDPWVATNGLSKKYITVCRGNDLCPTISGNGSEDGCPHQINVKKYDTIVITENRIELKQKIFFETNKAVIMQKSFHLLEEVADALLNNPAMKLRIEGHTDSRGSDQLNKKLSQARADSVKKHLIEKGKIDESRLIAIGFGPEKPIASNKTAAGREKNRRVEFHILHEDDAPAKDQKPEMKQEEPKGVKMNNKTEVKPDNKINDDLWKKKK